MDFHEVLLEIAKHEDNNPTHGINCVCMDDIIRKVRYEIYRKYEFVHSGKIRNRVEYVFGTASIRGL